VSEWSKWSAPDASGTRYRFRYMLRPALNGGKECPDLIQLGKGNIIVIYLSGIFWLYRSHLVGLSLITPNVRIFSNNLWKIFWKINYFLLQ